MELQIDLLLSILEKRVAETRDRIRRMPFSDKAGRRYFTGYVEATETDISLIKTLKEAVVEEPFSSYAEKVSS